MFKESLKDSKEFEQFVSDAVFGKAEERFVKIDDLEEAPLEIQEIRERLNQLEIDFENFKNKDDQLSREKEK